MTDKTGLMGTHGITDWIIAIGTVGALLLAVWQIRQNGRLARRDTAVQMWMEYLRCGLANPDLGETRIALKRLRIKNAEVLVSGDTLGSQRYLWFLTLMLDAIENLILHSYTELWRRTAEENVRYHRDALVFLWPHEKQYYSSELSELVERVLRT